MLLQDTPQRQHLLRCARRFHLFRYRHRRLSRSSGLWHRFPRQWNSMRPCRAAGGKNRGRAVGLRLFLLGSRLSLLLGYTWLCFHEAVAWSSVGSPFLACAERRGPSSKRSKGAQNVTYNSTIARAARFAGADHSTIPWASTRTKLPAAIASAKTSRCRLVKAMAGDGKQGKSESMENSLMTQGFRFAWFPKNENRVSGI